MTTAIAPTRTWATPATEGEIQRTAAALRDHGFDVVVVATGDEARVEALRLIPEGSEVHVATSRTSDAIGLTAEIEESHRFDAVRPKLFALDRTTQRREMRKLASAPDTIVGSVHAVTETGSVVIASMSGSQLAPYAQSAGRVVWVVGSQKIVPDLERALARIDEYTLPLEDERALAAYGVHSGVHKVLIVNREIQPGRATVIIIREPLGF